MLKFKYQELIHFTDKELKDLFQVSLKFDDHSVESKVKRMLVCFDNNESKDEVISYLKESIERIELAMTLLPKYKDTLEKVMRLDTIK